jgi:hypothetical protein
LEVAHQQACKFYKRAVKCSKKVFSIEEFRVFLVNLFVLSVLWAHFKKADEWVESHDVGNEMLSFEEFSLACRTFCRTHAQEELTDEQILDDFGIIDADHSNSIPFIEVREFLSI